VHHFLACRASTLHARRKLSNLRQPRQHRQLGEQALRHLQVEHLRDPVADIIQPLGTEREAHPAHRPEKVDSDRLRTALTILQQHVLEQQCRPSIHALHGPVRNLGDLQPGPDGVAHTGELPDTIYGRDKLTEIIQGHSTTVHCFFVPTCIAHTPPMNNA
jgi:hypothetical protein